MENTIENVLGPRFEYSTTEVYLGEGSFLNKTYGIKLNVLHTVKQP